LESSSSKPESDVSRQNRLVTQLEDAVAWNNRAATVENNAPVPESGLETFQGEYASRARDALWAMTVDDEVKFREQNPGATGEEAGSFVLHFPVEEQCPSTRSCLEAAAAYSDAETLEFATMIVIKNRVRNWAYFHDNRSRSGAWVRFRANAFVPGFA
jgi:hypothetical protein